MTTPDKFILYAAGTSAFREVPLALTGLPKEEAGLPVHYLHKEIIPIGVSRKHPDEGYEVHVSGDRAAKWVRAFKTMLERGHPIPAPPNHTDRDNSYGKWIDLSIERNDKGGTSLFGTLKVVGDKKHEDAANVDVSLCAIRNLTDDSGNVYDEALEHIAVTPFPALTGLSGWTSIAASRGHAVERVPVLEMTAPHKESTMDITALRKAIGAADTVPDADVIDQAATKLGTIPTIQADLELSRTAAREAADRVVELSRKAPEPDEVTLGLVSESLVTKRDAAIGAGGVDPQTAEKLMKLVAPDGKPNGIALSRCAGSTRPFSFLLFDVLAENKPLSLGRKTDAQPVPRSVPGAGGEMTEADIQAEVDRNLARTDLGRRAIGARAAR